MKFDVEIDDAVMDRLAAPIGNVLETSQSARTELARFALEEMLGWMAGSVSYQSLTQQYTEWVTELLPRFYPDKQPTANQVFNAFAVPYGRAAYIARVLMEKEHSVWRRRGREELLSALTANQARAASKVANGEGDTPVNLSIGAVAFREFTVLLDEIFADEPTTRPPRSYLTTPGRHVVELPAAQYANLIARIS